MEILGHTILYNNYPLLDLCARMINWTFGKTIRIRALAAYNISICRECLKLQGNCKG